MLGKALNTPLSCRCSQKRLFLNGSFTTIESLCEICQNADFVWFVFSRIPTEYGEILRISPYSFRMLENMDEKKLRIWTLFTQRIALKNYFL